MHSMRWLIIYSCLCYQSACALGCVGLCHAPYLYICHLQDACHLCWLRGACLAPSLLHHAACHCLKLIGGPSHGGGPGLHQSGRAQTLAALPVQSHHPLAASLHSRWTQQVFEQVLQFWLVLHSTSGIAAPVTERTAHKQLRVLKQRTGPLCQALLAKGQPSST